MRDQPCLTIGGQDPLRACVFPFVYRGQQYSRCSMDDAIDGRAWCPTAVQSDAHGVGHYFSFAFSGQCGPGCDREPSRKLQEDGCLPAQGRGAASVEARLVQMDAAGSGRRSAYEANGEGREQATPLPPLPAHCAPPPSPPPSPPVPPAMPPLSPPWLDEAKLPLALLGALLLLVVSAAAGIRWLGQMRSVGAEGGSRDGAAARKKADTRSRRRGRPQLRSAMATACHPTPAAPCQAEGIQGPSRDDDDDEEEFEEIDDALDADSTRQQTQPLFSGGPATSNGCPADDYRV